MVRVHFVEVVDPALVRVVPHGAQRAVGAVSSSLPTAPGWNLPKLGRLSSAGEVHPFFFVSCSSSASVTKSLLPSVRLSSVNKSVTSPLETPRLLCPCKEAFERFPVMRSPACAFGEVNGLGPAAHLCDPHWFGASFDSIALMRSLAGTPTPPCRDQLVQHFGLRESPKQ